ncbi:MAG: hypothetical protein HY721_24570, partial [Planctomycetes bacterium]|nr:hypothetical protein [Planctomycetota bacterium]
MGRLLAGDAATFVSETVPDGSSFAPGASFTKSWTLKNSGSTTWASTYKLSYVSGALSTSQADVPVTGSVAPGGTFTFSVPMRAPSAAGSYR